MFGFGKSKRAWAKAVFENRPKHPGKVSDELLYNLTTEILMQHHRIIMESAGIIRSTKDPATRKGRVELCREHYQGMLKLKPFCNRDQLALIKEAKRAMKGI